MKTRKMVPKRKLVYCWDSIFGNHRHVVVSLLWTASRISVVRLDQVIHPQRHWPLQDDDGGSPFPWAEPQRAPLDWRWQRALLRGRRATGPGGFVFSRLFLSSTNDAAYPCIMASVAHPRPRHLSLSASNSIVDTSRSTVSHCEGMKADGWRW